MASGPDDWFRDPNDRYTIESNLENVPIGTNAFRLSSAFGTVARLPLYCPITTDNWRRISKTDKKRMLRYMRGRFNIPENLDKYVVKSIGESWRNFKYTLRKSIRMREDSGETIEEIKNNPPDDVDSVQWEDFVDNYTDGQVNWNEIREKAQHIRSQLQENHTAGRKSFARLRSEMEASGQFSALDFYIDTHTKKKEKTMNEHSTQVLERIETLIAERTGNDPSLRTLALEKEVLSEVQGPNHQGRVKGRGRGVTPTSVAITHAANNAIEVLHAKCQSQQKEIDHLKNNIAIGDARVQALEDKLNEFMNGFNSS